MDEIVKALLAYGPGGIIAALVILGALIPKSIFDREVKRGDLATESSAKTGDALKTVSAALTVVTDSVKALSSEVSTLKDEVRDLRRDIEILRADK